jgi:hypothetical protein
MGTDKLTLLIAPVDCRGGQQGAIGLSGKGAVGSHKLGKNHRQIKDEQNDPPESRQMIAPQLLPPIHRSTCIEIDQQQSRPSYDRKFSLFR